MQIIFVGGTFFQENPLKILVTPPPPPTTPQQKQIYNHQDKGYRKLSHQNFKYLANIPFHLLVNVCEQLLLITYVP